MVSTGSTQRKQLGCHQHLMLMVLFLHVLSKSLVMVALNSYSFLSHKVWHIDGMLLYLPEPACPHCWVLPEARPL